MSETFDIVAKTFHGLEGVLASELRSLGAADIQGGRRMVSFRGDLSLMYRANIFARTAVRILKPIHSFVAPDEQALYRGVGQLDWLSLLDADGSLAIDPVVHGPFFTNSLYAAQLAKDAIVDQFRDRAGRRPSVDRKDPDLRVNLHIRDDRVTVYLDSSGDSLHKRGYRAVAGEAPINEVLAAGILSLTQWDQCSPLSDFMCGSGTFVIEAAAAARRIAPGLIRKRFGYMRWKDFCRSSHDAAMAEAARQARANVSFPLRGSDLDAKIIDAARENATRAGVGKDIDFSVENFDAVAPPGNLGVLLTNPPYDERMKAAGIAALYRRIGDTLKQRWPGHTAFILTGNPRAAKHIGLRPSRRVRLFNGPIECRLLKFDLFARQGGRAQHALSSRAASQAEDFGNRLARMARHWHRWARRQEISCYRLYDRDIPDVPLSIDWYAGHVHIIEHKRLHARTEIEQREWLARMVALVSETLEVGDRQTTLAQRPAGRAERQSREKSRVIHVMEAGSRFEVRLGSAKETGLELDQRILRRMLRAAAQGKRVLNLFGRTGTTSVAAAVGGAASTTTVEGSPQYVQWARRNSQLAGMSMSNHELICQDPLEFISRLNPADGPRFDLAIVRPPGFDGTRRPGTWNVQDGHAELLNRLQACMPTGGRIYFVTSFRRLKMHASQIAGASVREITRQTVPPDFRNKKIHRAWSIQL